MLNSQGRYVRFTTPTLDALIPESNEKLSQWKTKNFYFYEITNFKDELFIQLYFYCKNISAEMKSAFIHLSDILGLGELPNGYKRYFLSSAFKNKDDDSQETVIQQLDSLFEEVREFEATIAERW